MELHIKFFKKMLTGAIFPLTPVDNHAWSTLIFFWLHEMAAFRYFAVDLAKGLDHYSLSRLTDGTSHSSSDLLYFILLLPFAWTNYFKSNFFSRFCLFGQIFSKSSFSSLFSSDKNIPSPTSILQKYSEIIPNSVVPAKSFQSRKNFLSPISLLT